MWQNLSVDVSTYRKRLCCTWVASFITMLVSTSLLQIIKNMGSEAKADLENPNISKKDRQKAGNISLYIAIAQYIVTNITQQITSYLTLREVFISFTDLSASVGFK